MRNGNKDYINLDPLVDEDSSYPTYEEWKHLTSAIIDEIRSCSYPTYEEWKLDFLDATIDWEECSYPTYEEWKPSLKFSGFSKIPAFLSYL